MKKIVTVDGPAGSGKSTIAKLFANRIGYSYLDTGSLYRAVTHYLMGKKISPKETAKIETELKSLKIHIKGEQLFVNEEDATEVIRSKEINKNVALYAQKSEVRSYVKGMQIRIAEHEKFIVDGRDIGSVVFKDAFCKFYLDASVSVRAKRRFDEIKEKYPEKTLEEVESEIKERDHIDKTRKDSPLTIPVNAKVIDTSDLTIDQVMGSMIEYYNKCMNAINPSPTKNDVADSKMFLNALESFENKTLDEGTLIKGTILNIKPTEIILDVGQKKDGIIPTEEMKKLDITALKIGAVIDVYVMEDVPGSTQIIVSKLEADRRSGLVRIKEVLANGTIAEGEVLQDIKGGFLVNILGNTAFCPFSEYDVKKVNRTEQVGKKSEYNVIEVSGDKVVVSRKRLLEKMYAGVRSNFFSGVQVGDILEGTVVNITSFGAFVEIQDGLTAIMRPKNVAWKKFDNITDVVNRGDKVTVKVIYLDAEKEKIEVSRKDAQQDPIIEFGLRQKSGDVIKGVVRNIESFGAFIEVYEGVEGLLHVSELSWTKRVSHPSEVLKTGDFVEVKLLDIDMEHRKVSLGMKQVLENPWETIEQRYPVNEMVRAEVKSVIKNGVYCEIDGEYEGFIHIGDISWSTDKIQLEEMFKVGEKIDVKVIAHNKAKRRMDLGLKQKSSNPWEDLRNNYGSNGNITAQVTRIIDSGAFVRISDEIEGFCHVSQLSSEKVDRVEDIVKVGQENNFSIQIIDEKNKKVSLSIKEFMRNEEKKNIEKYLNNSESKETISFGDLVN